MNSYSHCLTLQADDFPWSEKNLIRSWNDAARHAAASVATHRRRAATTTNALHCFSRLAFSPTHRNRLERIHKVPLTSLFALASAQISARAGSRRLRRVRFYRSREVSTGVCAWLCRLRLLFSPIVVIENSPLISARERQ